MRLSDRTRADLEREVFGQEFGRYFKETLQGEAALAGFDGPQALIEFLRAPSEQYGRKDGALCALLRAYRAGGPRRQAIGALLLLILRPGLEEIVASKRKQFRSLEDLWGEVHWALLETAWHYPVERRPSRVANNLKLDTLRRLCAVRRKSRREEETLRALRDAAAREPETRLASPPFDVTTLDPQPATPEAERPVEALERACARAVAEGLISDLDLLLITATRVYGRELKEYARECGLAYEMAKKRRQRAERIVRELLQDRPGG